MIALATAAIAVALGSLSGRLPTPAVAAPADNSYARNPAVLQFAQDTAAQTGLNIDWLLDNLGAARYLPRIPPLMLPPTQASARDWSAYRRRFVEPTRIAAGVRFWHRNRAALERAEQEYGVPAAIIVGILGVETIYGRNTGSFRVLDALSTLAFDFPGAHPRADDRQAYFRGELQQFFVLCHTLGLTPTEVQGSYAGAMGIPQFMPSSWNRYAVDFDGDGTADLLASEADAIGSVANYFKGHGWRRGEPTTYPVQLQPDADLHTLLAPDIVPSFDAARFAELGATLQPQDRATPYTLALVELPNGDPDDGGAAADYVAGTNNFYVVTRYNHSAFYAMAVIELGQAVATAAGMP